ncbi:uncharacterized protein K02A2.6-like [Ornithodoros turicata]|uniref:uncharacterized protein K02A2.6-like n=1 Tax=Ornithodoros turicata TaxID=34597 RepID=UPI0031391A64
MRRVTANDTIHAFREIFLRQGLPEQLVTDNGPQFTSLEFKSFLGTYGVRHILTPPYHPKSNGQAENFVRSMKQALRRAKCGREEDPLGTFLSKYRSSPHISTGKTPCDLLNKRPFRFKLDLVRPSTQDYSGQSSHSSPKRVTRSFVTMDKVWVKDPTRKHHWVKGVIISREGNVVYDVQLDGRKRRRVHADHLKSRVSSDVGSPNASLCSGRPREPGTIPLSLTMDINLRPQASSAPPALDVVFPQQPPGNSTAEPPRRYPIRQRRPPARYRFTALGGRNDVDNDDDRAMTERGS